MSRSNRSDAAGVVFRSTVGNLPRPRFQRMLRAIFLIARPPLLAVMQGGEYACLLLSDVQPTTCGTRSGLTVGATFCPPSGPDSLTSSISIARSVQRHAIFSRQA